MPDALPRSKWSRFSLRAMLLMVLLAALAMSWVHQSRRQHVAAAALRASNPSATILYERRRHGDEQTPSRWRAWLGKRFGNDYAETVTGVELFYPTDADIEYVAELSRVEWLSLVRAVDLTDAGLAHVAGMRSLETFILLDAERVTDDGLKQLARLSKLRRLRIDLGRHRLDEAVLQTLKQALPRCTIETSAASDGSSQLAPLVAVP